MPDFLAGQTLTALHFTPSVSDTQNDQFSFDSTTFGVDADSGTYIECSVVFVAPFSGRVLVVYGANLDNSSAAASTNVAPAVRTGGVTGSGTDVVVAGLENAVRNVGTDDRSGSRQLMVDSLTPGSTYNVRLEHRVSGSTGTIQYRHLAVHPLS